MSLVIFPTLIWQKCCRSAHPMISLKDVQNYLSLILEHFVKKKWFNWTSFYKIVPKFPVKGKDPNNRPAVLRGKQMKSKATRRIIGTFSEIGNLIRSLPQILFDHILDTQDPFQLWLFQLRSFLRYISMQSITDTQIDEKDLHLEKMMNARINLTKVSRTEDDSI